MATASTNKAKKQERKNKISIQLNDSELAMLQRYCDRYAVRNRARFIRETTMRAILKQLEKDAPTLFDE